MNKEEILNKYQELLREYQEVEISRRKSVEEEKKLRDQKDIAEQKIEFEEAKERFEQDDTLSTEDIVKKAKLRQESLNKIEEERLNAEKNVKKLESKKEEIRKSAEEYYNSSLQSKLEELTNIKDEKVEEVEAKRREIKLKEWVSKDNSYRTTEEYAKLENKLKESMQDLRKIENDIEKETERLNKYGKQEKMGMEVAYKSFINGANRIDEGKFSEINKGQSENNRNEKFKDIGASGKALSESIKKMKESMEEIPEVSIPKIEKITERKEEKLAKPERIVKTVQPNKTEQVVIGQGKAQIAFDKKELDDLNGTSRIKKEKTSKSKQQELDKDFDIIDLSKEERKLAENSKSIRILYSARNDEYLVTNVNTGDQKVVSRKDIKKIDKRLLEERFGKQLENVDTNILQILLDYDDKYKTTKTAEYVKLSAMNVKNKKERQQEMKKNQIDIEYNLKGLYDQHEIELEKYEDDFSKEERAEILENANNAKKNGIAKVKKGILVSLLELVDKLPSKTNNLLPTKKVKKLPPLTQKEQENEEYMKGKVNKEYWKNINPKTYNKALRQAQKENRNRFTSNLDVGISLKEQRQRNSEIIKNKEEASRILKERAQKYNAQYEYKNNNYAPVEKNENETR